MTLAWNGLIQLKDNVPTNIGHETQITVLHDQDEIILVWETGRAAEFPAGFVNGLPSNYVQKYNRSGESCSNGQWDSRNEPLYFPMRSICIRRFVPFGQQKGNGGVPIDSDAVNTPAQLFTVPCGMFRPYGDPGVNSTGGWGISPNEPPDELRADLTIERCPCWTRDNEQLSSYYRLSRSFDKTTTFPYYVIPVTSDPNDGRRMPIQLTPITAQYYGAIASFDTYDGQHLIRAYRYCELNDPAHQRFLHFLAQECAYAWDITREDAYLATTPNQGSDIGREAGWVGLLAARARADILGYRMKTIIQHVARDNGITQRVPMSNTTGFTPDPWLQCNVPPETAVAQGIEMDIMAVCMHALGMNRLCEKLMQTIWVDDPNPKKWIDPITGKGVGNYGYDAFDPWFGIPAAIRGTRDRKKFFDAMQRIRMPKDNEGSIVGPYTPLSAVRAGLVHWNDLGKMSDAVACIDEFGGL